MPVPGIAPIPVTGHLQKPWAPPPQPLRPRARRRVLYPPLVRRTRPKEQPDLARRSLLLLSALLFLQIYTEEGVSTGPWEPLQAESVTPTTATASGPSQQHPQGGPSLECKALEWGGPGELEMELEPCSELCVNLPARVQRLVA